MIQGHPRSKMMLLTDSSWVISYLTSTDPTIASITIFEIFDV